MSTLRYLIRELRYGLTLEQIAAKHGQGACNPWSFFSHDRLSSRARNINGEKIIS